MKQSITMFNSWCKRFLAKRLDSLLNLFLLFPMCLPLGYRFQRSIGSGLLTLERPRGGVGSNGPPTGFSDPKFEALKQSK